MAQRWTHAELYQKLEALHFTRRVFEMKGTTPQYIFEHPKNKVVKVVLPIQPEKKVTADCLRSILGQLKSYDLIKQDDPWICSK